MRIWRATLAAALAGALGCGGGPSALGVVSCTQSESRGPEAETLRLCEEAGGLESLQIQQACSVDGGTTDGGITFGYEYRNGPCTHVRALGGCLLTPSGVTVWYYQSGALTSADVAKICTGANETFVAP